MRFFSLQAFVPSGSNFEASKHFFKELGFTAASDDGDYIDFEKDGCSFVLQNFSRPGFAENFMMAVQVDDAEEFRNFVHAKNLPEKYGIRIGEVTQQPYGKEVNMLDIAGVCWHFVQR